MLAAHVTAGGSARGAFPGAGASVRRSSVGRDAGWRATGPAFGASAWPSSRSARCGRARGRARAPPRRGRGTHAHRPRPARLGRARDQRDPRPGGAGRLPAERDPERPRGARDDRGGRARDRRRDRPDCPRPARGRFAPEPRRGRAAARLAALDGARRAPRAAGLACDRDPRRAPARFPRPSTERRTGSSRRR